MNNLNNTPQLEFVGQTGFYRGKVRDVYEIGNVLAILSTDRISAYDQVFPFKVKHKGQVLTEISNYMFAGTADICPNHLIDDKPPAPNAVMAYKCEQFKVEVIVRGNLCGSAWRQYKDGNRLICGVRIPNGLKENDFLPQPILTPTTKEKVGKHDQDISEIEILNSGLVGKNDWDQIREYALALFIRGSSIANQKGLVLADTKYEFGKLQNKEIRLTDEVNTPDSSRYFYLEGFEENQEKGLPQRDLSKEFFRKILAKKGFTGKPHQELPKFNNSEILEIQAIYFEIFEKIMGRPIVPSSLFDSETQDAIQRRLDYYKKISQQGAF